MQPKAASETFIVKVNHSLGPFLFGGNSNEAGFSLNTLNFYRKYIYVFEARNK